MIQILESLMIGILVLLFTASLPIVMLVYGKRFLGDQTHPAALFILSWMATSLILSSVGPADFPSGVLSFAWVTLCFVGVAVVRKLRKLRKPAATKSESK